jgi:sigma-B regulation protein RsbU (phosphoserine phosphatase)
MLNSSLDLAQLQVEIDLARRVQLSLLPKELPRVPGLEIWGASRTAHQVGGDFYDFVERPGGRVTFVVGDVSGKGMAAALLMAVTRRVIRTQANFRSRPGPATIIHYANRELYSDFTNSAMFATVFVGEYDPATHRLTFANAGHSPVIFRPAGGPPQVLIADATALGVLPENPAQEQTVQFRPGDLLIIGTDGLNETRNDRNRLFGYYGLKQTVEANAHLPAHGLVAELFAATERYSMDGAQQDDQTVVVLKRTGTGSLA